MKLFELGDISITPAAAEAVTEDEVKAALARHATGDWGVVSADDAALNDAAVKDGDRVVSAYLTADGGRFWVITEASRDVTTVLLPEDY